MELIAQFLPAIAMIGALYFFMIRPQQKAAQQKRQMVEAMKKGDAVVTIGGLHGIVDEVDVAKRIVVLDCEGVYLTFELSAIGTVKNSTPEVVETTTDAE